MKFKCGRRPALDSMKSHDVDDDDDDDGGGGGSE